MRSHALRIALLILVSLAPRLAPAADSQADSSSLPDTTAALCLGEAEAWLSWLAGTAERSSSVRGYDTTPLKNSAVGMLSRMQRILDHLASRGKLSGTAEGWQAVQERERGVRLVVQCIHDQEATYFPCQADCHKTTSGSAEAVKCVDKCQMPKSCDSAYKPCDRF